MKHNVPIQSLIDHIKTAIDVDPWAKEMVEELLKEKEVETIECKMCGHQLHKDWVWCPWCRWEIARQEGRCYGDE